MAEIYSQFLLERENEVDGAREMFESVPSGEGSVLLLSGPAGIGKTRLLAALTDEFGAEALVLRASGSAMETNFAFGVVRQLFEAHAASLDSAERARAFAGAAAGARSLLDPSDASEPPDTSSYLSDQGEATLRALYWLATNLTVDQPVLITIDDAHWADWPSLRFLSYLSRRIDGIRMMAVVAARPFDPHADFESLDEIRHGSATRVFELRPLGAESLDIMVTEALNEVPSPQFSEAFQERTGGNPFLTRELLVELGTQNVEPNDAGASRVPELAPDSVARAVKRRLNQLPAQAQTLAAASAILAEAPQLANAAALADLNATAAEQYAELLARSEIFDSQAKTRFAHPIVREVIYAEIPAEARGLMHLRAAELLAEQGADPGRVAAHLLLAPAPAGDWALSTLQAAATLAVSQGATDVASLQLKRALAEASDEAVRADLLAKLGEAEIASEVGPSALNHLRQSIELQPDPQTRAEVAIRLGQAQFAQGLFSDAAITFDFALAGSDAIDRVTTEKLEAGLLSATAYDGTQAHRAMNRVPDLLRRVGLGEVTDGGLIAGVAMMMTSISEPASTGADLARGVIADGQAVKGLDPFTLLFAGSALGGAGCLQEEHALWTAVQEESQRIGSVSAFAFSTALRVGVNLKLGNVTEAESDARAALDVVPAAQAPVVAPFIVGGLIDSVIELGDLEQAERLIVEHQMDGTLSNVVPMNFVLNTRGRLRLEQRRYDEAIDDLFECGTRIFALGVRNPAMLPWRPSASLALAAADRKDEGLQLARMEEKLAVRFQVLREQGMALRATGLIERGRTGIASLRKAVDALASSPGRLEHARALTDLGAALRRSGKRVEAREQLRLGLDMAQRCGARALADRGRAELLATGAKPRRDALSGVESLTPSERRACNLVATGLSNRDVAQALFVTEKTVETHLGHAFRKLDITSRRELAGKLGPTPSS